MGNSRAEGELPEFLFSREAFPNQADNTLTNFTSLPSNLPQNTSLPIFHTEGVVKHLKPHLKKNNCLILLHLGTVFVIFYTEVTRLSLTRSLLWFLSSWHPPAVRNMLLSPGTILFIPSKKKKLRKLHTLTSALGQNQLFVVAHSSQGKVVLRRGHNGINHRDIGGCRDGGDVLQSSLCHLPGFPAVPSAAAAPQSQG